jgi:hypothetical protein
VEEMKYVLLGRLLDRYSAEQGIEVRQAEVDACINAMQRMADQDRQQRATRREELQRKLADTKLDDAGYRELSAELEVLDELAASLDETAGDAEEDHEVRVQIASAFTRQWKINRALYL